LDQKEYQSMIGSLLYLTAARPDIQFSVCLCAHFQALPRTSHLLAIKRVLGIFNTLLSSVFGTQRPFPFHLLVFRMPTSRGVESIGNQLRVLACFWVLCLFLGLLANNLV
jgi:hypothetical protein